jgi:hypothetical protein
MPREGAIIFRDIVGKLDVLSIECDKCGRKGRYRVDRLVKKYGIDAKLFDWSDEVTADCPRKIAGNLNDTCGAKCPDLPKVVSDWGYCVLISSPTQSSHWDRQDPLFRCFEFT